MWPKTCMCNNGGIHGGFLFKGCVCVFVCGVCEGEMHTPAVSLSE
jgi:hypothetical protein